MSGNPESRNNGQEWQIPDEWKTLIQEGIYGLDRKRTKEYEQSEHGQKELAEEEKLDKSVGAQLIQKRLAQLEQDVKAGNISEAQANKFRDLYLKKYEKMQDEAIKRIDDYRADYKGSLSVGDPEEEARYRAWLESKDGENAANLGDRKYTAVDNEYKIVDSSDKNASPDNSDSPDSAPDKQQSDDDITRLSDDDVDVIPPDPNRFFPGNRTPQIPGPTTIDRAPQITGPTIIDQAPQLPGPTINDKASQLPGPVSTEEPKIPDTTATNKDPNHPANNPEDKNKVEIGEINIDGIEQKFAEDKSRELAAVEKELEALMPEMAELYARNRRLIVGNWNRAKFNKVRGEYSKLLDKCLKLRAEKTFEKGKHEIADKIDKRVEELRAKIEKELTEFAGGDLEKTEKSQEVIDAKKSELIKEAEEALRKEYSEEIDKQKTKINVEFLADFIAQETKLEEATVHALDNGSFCRKFVNKVINNKALKIALVGAAAAGLAVTGVGLVAGGLSIGFSLTAGGFATGALKGGLSGFLMSRQNSKNSAVRAFADESEIVRQLQGIDVTKQDASTANVAKWLMKQYGNASEKDRRSNVKKTAISVGLGAAIGGFTSGIKLGKNVTQEVSYSKRTGTNPVNTEYNIDANLSQVNQPQGTGLYKTMEQMGVPKEKWDEALKIAYDIEPRYGLSPGSNGVTAGFNGTVGRLAEAYPGPINTWPDTAQAFITETAKEWAKQGLMSSEVIRTGGEPTYDIITKTTTDFIPNAFMSFLTRATAIAGASALGGAIGGFGGTARAERVPARTERTPSRATGGNTAPNPRSPEELSGMEGEITPELFRDLLAFYDSTPDDDVTGAPEGKPQPTNPDDTNNPEAEPANQPNNPTNPEAQTDNSETETDVKIPEDVRNLIGTDNMNLLMNKNEYNDERDRERYDNLWNELPEAIKSQIGLIFFNQYRNSENGRTFRQWYSAHGNATNQ